MNIDLRVTIQELQKSKIVNPYSIFGLSCHITKWAPFRRVFSLRMTKNSLFYFPKIFHKLHPFINIRVAMVFLA